MSSSPSSDTQTLPMLFENAVNPDDPRLGDFIKSCSIDDVPIINDSQTAVAIVGFPYDEGTARNGGRIGGKNGSQSFRKIMNRMGTLINPELNVDLTQLIVIDVGDSSKDLKLEEAHEKHTEYVHTLLSKGYIVVSIGGSNDQSYCSASAALRLYDDLTVVNIDAHLDVRPLKQGLAHSGSPFRQLLEDSRFNKLKYEGQFTEFAAQGHQCSKMHADYVKSKHGMIYWLNALRMASEDGVRIDTSFKGVLKAFKKNSKHSFVSFDIDSISGTDCPGVSAPSTIGIGSWEACKISFEAGKFANTVLFDMSEYNPVVEDYRTGKLMGTMFYYFLAGIASRKS